MSYDRRESYRTLYARVLLAMSWDQALQTLGFPSSATPDEAEVEKRRRQLATKNHPDRGGDPNLMVEVNVAADILTGKSKPGRTSLEAEMQRKRERALEVIDRAQADVESAIDIATRNAEIGKGKLHLRDFFSEDYADALDKMQDMIEAESNPHPDMKKAEALCQTLSNKALRLGKRYLALLKLQGEVTAGRLGLGGADPVTFSSLGKLYSETSKFIAAFADMWQESRKLVYLMRTSENVPYEWDDIYGRSHDILDAFATSTSGGFKGFNDQPLKAYQSAVVKAVKAIGDVVLEIDPDAWKKAPTADEWRQPQDFKWAKDIVRGSAKTAFQLRARVMDTLARLVARRFHLASRVASQYKANVVPLTPKPTGPTIAIGGRKYALSDYWSMMEGLEESNDPRLILPEGPTNKFRYLWAFDTDKRILGMWRVSDGDEKAFGRENQHSRDLVVLEKKRQLNRVTNEEFRGIERFMKGRQADALAAMKKYLEENADEWDRESKRLVEEFFKKSIEPKILAKFREIDQGVIPFGFKPNESHRPPLEAAKMHVAMAIFGKEFTLKAVDDFVRTKGIDPDNPPGDIQALDWARHDVMDAFYEAHFPHVESD